MLDIGYILDGKYEVLKVLGEGGMGTVYLCKNIRLDNLWAVKEVKKKENIDFLAEPNILKKLKHPGIPRVIDIFYENNKLYMVEDYVEGVTLKDYIKKNKYLNIEKMKSIVLEICDIIGYLHSLNPPIIYRDLKPSNIMITPEDKVVLIDFGISKIYKEDKESDTIAMGSNGYAAPEQCGLGQSCVQTDIYGIGMVMYYMLQRKTASTALEPLMDENYCKEVNSEFKRIIQKCVQIDVSHRYASTEDLKREIESQVENGAADEKTILMDERKAIPKIKRKNPRLSRSVAGLLIMAVLVIAGTYLLSARAKANNNISNSDTGVPVSSNNVLNNAGGNEETPSVEQNQPAKQNDGSNADSNDDNNGDNNNINNNSNDIKAPTNPPVPNNRLNTPFTLRGRAKGKKKK